MIGPGGLKPSPTISGRFLPRRMGSGDDSRYTPIPSPLKEYVNYSEEPKGGGIDTGKTGAGGWTATLVDRTVIPRQAGADVRKPLMFAEGNAPEADDGNQALGERSDVESDPEWLEVGSSECTSKPAIKERIVLGIVKHIRRTAGQAPTPLSISSHF